MLRVHLHNNFHVDEFQQISYWFIVTEKELRQDILQPSHLYSKINSFHVRQLANFAGVYKVATNLISLPTPPTF